MMEQEDLAVEEEEEFSRQYPPLLDRKIEIMLKDSIERHGSYHRTLWSGQIGGNRSP
jgi:hypothetical protein